MNKEDYFKYYIQGSDHYLIPKDVFKELFEEMSNWREEVKELKEKYLNAVADYETTMFEKEQLNSLVNSCQEEIRQLKKQLEVGEEQYNDLVEEKEKLDAENQVLKDYKNVALTYMKNYLKMELNYRNKDVAEHFKMVIDMLNRGNKHDNLVDITDCDTQQKEFIEYMNKTIEELECDDVDDEEMKGYLIQRIDNYKEILSKYKEIIGRRH